MNFETNSNPPRNGVGAVLGVLSSLKLTVALLGMSIFLIFVGTLAQIDSGIWTVVDRYFRCWVAQIDARLVFTKCPSWLWIPFPGGKLLGAALVVNLLVSHAMRIRLLGRGRRLALGVATLAVGTAVTWLVISSVFDADSSEKKIDPSLRITLQLIYGTVAAVILFGGCHLLFGRKAGIVLLHAGVVLMMSSELVVDNFAEEGMMTVNEGEAVDYVQDTRKVELALVDESDPAANDVAVVSRKALRPGKTLRHPDLPCDVELVGAFMRNAHVSALGGDEKNPATAGAGLQYKAVERGEEPGASSAGRVDEPAAYVAFKDRETGAPLGTYLVALRLTFGDVKQQLKVKGKTYDVSLRFKRTYKPYRVYLYNFNFERYVGTSTPKDFSSYVRLLDPERGTDRNVRIWMNNPLRYRGDTLYQASYDQETETATVLQVVTNSGWMLPYVACMIVAVGLLGQFGLHLVGFLRKLGGGE